MKIIKCFKVNKKYIMCFVIALIFLLSSFFAITSFSKYKSTINSPYNLTIVLDAGHGGIDGGCVGTKTGIKESDLNLIFTNKLEKLLKSVGINVVKTRNDDNSLAKSTSSNFKKEDMQKRKDIILKSNAQMVVSIHMNKFSLSSENGSQVFYQKEDEKGQKLANCIRDELVKNIENSRELTLGGNYFMCKCDNIPSVIVECGFLSNENEELLLQQENYQDKFCYTVFCGIIRFLTNYYSLF